VDHRTIFSANDDATLVLQITKLKMTNINCILQDMLQMQTLNNTHILNFLNTLFGILSQNDGHFNDLDLHLRRLYFANPIIKKLYYL
jgi:hypothetical protein